MSDESHGRVGDVDTFDEKFLLLVSHGREGQLNVSETAHTLESSQTFFI